MFSKDEIKRMLVVGMIITFGVIVYHLFDNFKAVLSFIMYINQILMPLFIGFAIAYVFNIPMRGVENLLFSKIFKKFKIKLKYKRSISLLLTLILFVFFSTILLSFMIPQFTASITRFGTQIPTYVKAVSKFLNEKLIEWNLNDEIIDQLVEVWNNFLTSMKSILGTIVLSVRDFFFSLFDSIVTTILSVVLAVYMLLSKESLILTVKKGLHAYFPKKITDLVVKYMKLTNSSFNHFIQGQMVEALILGILCFLGMTLFGFEYALLISVIVGLTNIIPMFGPYIGAAPSILILLVVDPMQAVWFIVYVTVLQQIESNLIYPRVVGSSMGISGFWILIAVIVGNNLFGILGIILGIPVFSTLHEIIGEITENKLQKKKIKVSNL